MTVDDMLAMQRISEHEVSADGAWVAFSVRTTDMDANRGRFDLYVASTSGSQVRRLTTHVENDTSPQWSPDGRWIYFLSTRSGGSQVWRIAPAGGEAEPVTKVPLDVNGFRLFPDGRRLVLAMDVWPEAKSLAESVAKDEAKAKEKSTAQVYDSLLFRHWDTWEDGKYSHLFVWSPEAPDTAKDVTPGLTTDAPTHPFGGMDEVALTPDGRALVYTARVGGKVIAYTTNTDLFWVNVDGAPHARNLTAGLGGYDSRPTFSPDGKTLAFLSMERPGFEADRQRIAVMPATGGPPRFVAPTFDRSASTLVWSSDNKTIFTTADDLGNHSLFAVDVTSGAVTRLFAKGTNAEPRLAGNRLVFAHDNLKAPVELYTIAQTGGEPTPITTLNAARTAAIEWGEYQQFSFTGAHGDKVYGFVMKPAGYRGGKVPLAMLIHGGPQGSFGDHFHYRWNPQAYAGAGFGVVFIDFHGSTGYGQGFTDAIRGDWGGAPYEDLMKGMDAALSQFSWLDGKRAVALGASYGGFMINWINGQTDRFRALVCHDGNLDERMAYFDTEELWFPEWEHLGVPWDPKSRYGLHNPVDHVAKWKTPTLVIHGGRDYRVVDTQGMSTFTALQRRGVPSRFVYFPDENHWVLRPHNSKKWHAEVIGWIRQYTK